MKIEGSNEITTQVRKSAFTETKQPEDKSSTAKHGSADAEEGAIVDFSERSKDIQRIQQVLQSQPDVRSDKVKAIKEKIEKGTYEIDFEGNITFYNDSLCKIAGYSCDEMKGMNFRQCMDEEDSRKVKDAFNKVHKTGGYSTAIDWELIRKDGSKAFVESSVSLIRDSENHPIGFRGIVRDVTLRKRSEVALKRAKDYAETANKSKSEFLANMSHEIRTPMNAVIGFTDILLDSALDQSQKDYVLTLKRSGEDLLSLINTILDFSKIESC